MDYIEKILNDFEDDFGPSATVPESRPMFNDGGRIPFEKAGPVKLDPANLKRKQDGLQNYYDKFGKETLDKLSKKSDGKVFNKLGTNDLSNFKRRITKFEDFIKKNNRMPTEKEARSIGRQPRIQKEQAIQIKLLEETNTGKFFDPEKFAKKNNISMKELKREAGLLQTNIYNKRMKMSGKEMRRVLDWIPDDASVSDNALNKLWKSKLIKYERNKIEELFYDAFGREFVKGTKDKNPNFNPKKHLAIRNNLTEYYQLREAINLKYPNINLALDHPLSKSTLKKVFNATPDQLTRVNPLEADLNNGFKDTLSLQYEKAIQGRNIPQKKAVEKIARDLKLNIGKVNNDATNFKYGVKEFQKLNMKDEVLKAVQTQADLSSNFKNYVKQNPDLFKTANVNPNTNITKVTQSQVKQIEKNLLKLSGQIDPDCKQASADGGRIGLKTIGSPNVCITKARNYMSEELTKGIGTQQNAKTSLIKRILAGSANFLKQSLSPKELFKMENLIGKPALYGAAAFETGIVADDVLRKGKPLNVAAAESLFGSVLNLDADAARAKNLLESNTQLSPAAKEYAQNILDYDKYRKLDLSFPSSLVAKNMPGSDKYFKMQEDLKKKIESTPDTGVFDYQSALDESEGAFKAKPKFLDAPDAPDVTPLTNKFASRAKTRGPMTAKKDMKIDLTPLTYQNFKPDYGFTKEQFEDAMRKEGVLADDEVYQDAFYKQGVEKPIEFEQLMKLPSFRGASEKFAGGGIAKMAGDRSGPPPVSGPQPQGLSYLFNRVKKV